MNLKNVNTNGNNVNTNSISLSVNNNNILNVFTIKTAPLGYIKGDTDNLEQYNYPKMFGVYSNNSNCNCNGTNINNNNECLSHRKYNNELSHEDNINTSDNKRYYTSKRQSSKLSTEMLPSNYSKKILQEEEEDDDVHSCNKDFQSPYILSYNYYHQYSYLTGHYKSFLDKEGELRYPSPVIIDDDIWITPPNLAKCEILKGMNISNELGLILSDANIIKRFKIIVKEMLIQVSKTTINETQKLYLPIKAFEPKSFLQSISEYLLYLPKYLNKVSSKHITPLERMKNIMTFAVSGLYIPNKQLKPFNPLIGETFQGTFLTEDHNHNKINVYLEQISNYPFISRLLIQADKYTVSGYFDIEIKNERAGNKITIIIKSKLTVYFKEIKESVSYMMPHIRVLNGAASNKQRGLFFINTMIFVDSKNKLKGIIRFAQNKKQIHQIEGGIFEDSSCHSDYSFSYEKEAEFGNKFKYDNRNMLTVLTGSWLEDVRFDNVCYWNINKDVPCWIQPVKYCLPSDGRFREDIIWLYRAYHNAEKESVGYTYEYYAQKWKCMLEGLQKEEREIKSKNKRKVKIRKSKGSII